MCGVPGGWTICEIVLLGQSRLLGRLDKLSRWPCSNTAYPAVIIDAIGVVLSLEEGDATALQSKQQTG